jgi:hypothetical protein
MENPAQSSSSGKQDQSKTRGNIREMSDTASRTVNEMRDRADQLVITAKLAAGSNRTGTKF